MTGTTTDLDFPTATRHLSKEQVTRFVGAGYVVLPGLLSRNRIQAGLDELKRSTGVVPDDPDTWPEGSPASDMGMGQDGGVFARSVCVTPELSAIVRELADASVACTGMGPILRFPVKRLKACEPDTVHIDGTRQGKGITLFPTHLQLVVMAYLTDADASRLALAHGWHVRMKGRN